MLLITVSRSGLRCAAACGCYHPWPVLGVKRQRLKQLRDEGRLLGISHPFHRGFLYPRWQFGADLRPHPFLPAVLSAARQAGIDGVTVHRMMTRAGSGADPSLLALCLDGREELAINALRRVGELGG